MHSRAVAGKESLLTHQRVEAFYRQAPFATRTNVALAVVTAVVMWNRVPSALLIGWVVFVALGHVVRLSLYRSYFADAARDARARIWAGRCTFAMLLSGIAWGGGGVVMFLPEQPLILAFWLIALCGIAAGVVTANAFHLPATYAYVLPLLVPMIARLVLEGTWEHGAIATGMTLFLGFALVQGGHQARLLADSIAMRLENVDLVGQLRLEKSEADVARGAAEETAHAKARFLAAASHDLRQPLHALGLFAAALRETESSPDKRMLIDRLFASIDALEELFNGVLDLARLDAGVQPRFDHFPVTGLLARIEHQFAIEANQKGLAFRVTPSAAVVRCDPIMLERMLGNLVANAIRYTDAGAVMVVCRWRPASVLIQVRDSGRGISPGEQQRIYEEFYQIGNLERDRAKGLGIGLATVKRMAEALGVRVQLSSAPGQGSTFQLALPAGEASRVAPGGEDPEVSDFGPLTGKRVLIIDDELPIRDGMCELLRQWGCLPVSAEDLPAARVALNEAIPDAIVADLRLRDGVSGIALIAELRRLAQREVPALLVSGDTAAESVRAMHESGIAMLAKPVRPVQLRAVLAQLLR